MVLSWELGSFTREEQHCFGALPRAGTWDMKTHVPCYLSAPGGLPGPFPHMARVWQSLPSVLGLPVSPTPHFSLSSFLQAGWGGKKGSHFEG